MATHNHGPLGTDPNAPLAESPPEVAKPAGGRRDPWLRVAALAGAASLPLFLAGTMFADVESGPAGLYPGSPDSQLVRVFVEHRDQQLVAASLYAAGAVATLVFLGPLWARLRAGAEWLAVVAVAGGVAAGVLWLVIGAGWSVTAVVAADFDDAAAARFLMVAGWESSRLTAAPYMVMVAAATVTGFRHHVFGAWFNCFGLGITAILALALLPSSPAGLMGMLATVWVLVASLVLAFGKGPKRSPRRQMHLGVR